MKFSGVIGFCKTVEGTGEWGKGKWEDEVTEKPYKGDIIRNRRRFQANSETVHKDTIVSNTISITADDYLYKNFGTIKYVKWMGQYWEVSDIDVDRPRILISLGGIYNGPTARSSEHA